VFWLIVCILFTPAITHASLAGLIGQTFGYGGPGFPVTLIVVMDIGRWLVKQTPIGSNKYIDPIIRALQAGIAVAAVLGFFKTIFDLMGL
jgi:hypothetical protein